MLWIYYSSLILPLGAEFTAVRSGEVQPKPGAMKVEEEVAPAPKAA